MAAPQARLPWEKLSAASPVHQKADDMLRFEPTTSIDVLWETFKAEYGTRPVRMYPSVETLYVVNAVSCQARCHK